MTPRGRVAVAALGLALAGATAAAQTGDRPRITALTMAGPITLDGRLDEPFWAAADSIDDFRQREPRVGAPATERTVVRVVRDAEALYVGVRCADAASAGIRATQLRRDADLSSDDNVQLLIDSFDDHRDAFLFGTNPNGAMWDAQFSGVDDLNENWNGVWTVAVARDAGGWTAEFRIPLLALRYRPHPGGALGFNVRRYIRRKNEEDLWTSFGRAQGMYHLDQDGAVTGVGDTPAKRAVELYPYALVRGVEPAHDIAGATIAHGLVDAKGGADAKVGVSPTVTADLTVNTDFAQVEADQQVINLTRFPFFFPEKREFFLESSALFDLGTPEKVQLFYSRRTGLDSTGAAVPILAGGRMYGRVGPWRLGALDVETGGADRANDAVVRIEHDLFDRSYVGAIATLHADGGRVARAGGFDVDLPLVVRGMNLEPKFWIAGSGAEGTPGTPLAWRISTDNPNDLFDNFVSLYRIERGFAPPLGFVGRTGIWETTGHVDFMPRPGILGIRQLDITVPIPIWDIIARDSGTLTRRADWETASLQWLLLGGDRDNGDHFEFLLQRFLDAPPDTFPIYSGVSIPPGRYWWTRWEVLYAMAPARPLSFRVQASRGGFYGGRSTDLDLSAEWRGNGHLILGTELIRTAARLPAGAFTALLSINRLEYDFTTRTSALAFVQFDGEDQRVDFNVRFHWIPVIGDDLFVVWNSGYTTDPLARHRFPDAAAFSRQLNGAFVVKFVHRIAP